MKSALEFHDSEVASVLHEGDVLRVVFSGAYIHRSSGRPGLDSGDGLSQAVEISFKNPKITGKAAACRGNLWDGRMSIAGRQLDLLPVPFDFSGPVRAELTFASGERLGIDADAVTCKGLGEPVFVEHFRC